MPDVRHSLVLLAHGTREPAGQAALEELGRAVGDRLEATPVAVAHLGNGPAPVVAVLDTVGAAVLVPVILGEGHHVAVDLPALAESRPGLLVTRALGPDPLVVAAVADRVRVALQGRSLGAVVLTAAGSGRPRARAQARTAALALRNTLGAPSVTAYLSGPGPGVAEAVEMARARAHGRTVVLASYLMAPGHFQSRLVAAAADHGTAHTAPLGSHPALVELVVRRYRGAVGQ